MIPKRVTLENFLSFGPKTEIAFTDDEPLWVLGGSNGVGKSAVFDAITFCLFGAHRGGANAAFADGHGQFLSEKISPTVLEMLAAMADGTTGAGP